MAAIIDPNKLQVIINGLNTSIDDFKGTINRIIKRFKRLFINELIIALILLGLTGLTLWIGSTLINGESLESIIGNFLSTLGLGGLGIAVNLKKAINSWTEYKNNRDGLDVIITALEFEVQQFTPGMTTAMVQQKLNALNQRKACYFNSYRTNRTNPHQLVAELLKC